MNVFNLFKKKENSIDDIKQWENFCMLDNSFKNDIKLKPIYYLKIYGKNVVNNNSKMKKLAKEEYTRAILNNIQSENIPILRCIIEYLIMKYEILDNAELIDILTNLNKDSLQIIANSHSHLSYIQMRNKIIDISNVEIKELVEPLVKILEKNVVEYKTFISKHTKELKDYLYDIHNIMMNEKFESYKFNNNEKNIYFYENGLVLIFNEDEKNLYFDSKICDKEIIPEIKRLLFIDNELFSKNYKEIIWNDNITLYIKNLFYMKKPFYTFKHNIYNNIDFYYHENGIAIKCKYLDDETFEKVIVIKDFMNEDEIMAYIQAIEKIIVMKENILDNLYNFTLKSCIDYENSNIDINGEEITKEYIKKYISKISIYISSITDTENIEYSFLANIFGYFDEYPVCAKVQGNDIKYYIDYDYIEGY